MPEKFKYLERGSCYSPTPSVLDGIDAWRAPRNAFHRERAKTVIVPVSRSYHIDILPIRATRFDTPRCRLCGASPP